MNTRSVFLISLLALMPSMSVHAESVPSSVRQTPAQAELGPMSYNRQKDTLSLEVKDEKLSSVLFRLGLQAALDVRMDMKVERPVTLSFKDVPLEKAVDRLTSQLNVLKSFEKKGKKNLLVQVVVLPEGKYDASAATRLLDIDRELGLRAGQLYSQTADGQRTKRKADMLAERWAARQLTPQQRAAYEADLKRLEERALAREKRNEERKTQHEEQRAQVLESLPADARARRQNPVKPSAEQQARARAQFAQPVTPAIIEGKVNDGAGEAL